MIPSYFKIEILAIEDEFVLLWHKGLKYLRNNEDNSFAFFVIDGQYHNMVATIIVLFIWYYFLFYSSWKWPWRPKRPINIVSHRHDAFGCPRRPLFNLYSISSKIKHDPYGILQRFFSALSDLPDHLTCNSSDRFQSQSSVYSPVYLMIFQDG